jgi:uncharacterized damage-inducible protein DinB
MQDLLTQQYAFVKDSRSALLMFCEKVSNDNFVAEVKGFGRGGSIRNLLVHSANSSLFWMVRHCFGEPHESLVYDHYHNVGECVSLYQKIDEYMQRLINSFKQDYCRELSSTNAGQTFFASPLKVYTHVITHEFHHKGQILSIARHLGYIPVDTDVIRA